MVGSSPSSTRTRGGSKSVGRSVLAGEGGDEEGLDPYPLAGFVLLCLGLLVMPSLSGCLRVSGFRDGRTEVRGLLQCLLRRLHLPGDLHVYCRRIRFFSRPLVFRDLPIPAGSLVGGRAVSLLFALVLNVSAFFLPAFFFSDLGGSGHRTSGSRAPGSATPSCLPGSCSSSGLPRAPERTLRPPSVSAFR